MANQTNLEWDENSQFTLTGREFMLFINVVRNILREPDSLKVLALAEMDKIMEKKLEEGITNGTVTIPSLSPSIPAEQLEPQQEAK